MKNKLSSVLIVFSLLLGILFLSGCKKQETPEEVRPPETEAEEASATITRGQWITMLAEAFCLDTYQSETPYYSDITSSNPLFPSVQAAKELGILSNFSGETFDASKLITRQEIADTAAIASGYSAENEVSAYAIGQGIIPASGELTENPTPTECENAIEASKSIYLSLVDEEEILVDPNDDLIDFSRIVSDNITVAQEQITLSGEIVRGIQNNGTGLTASIDTNTGIVDVKIGSVFITAPTIEHPSGVAYKVTSIVENADGVTLLTEAPTLDELYDELVVHTSVEADLDNIIWADGVSASSVNGVSSKGNGGDYYISLLSYGGEQPQITQLDTKSYATSASYDFNFAEGNYEKRGNNQNSRIVSESDTAQVLENSNFVYDATPSIADFNDSTPTWTKELKPTNKFDAGYKISGNITINAITVTTHVEFHKTQFLFWEVETPVPESAGLQLTSDITTTLKFEGNLNERLKIGTVAIPIAATGLSVSVDLYLYVDASGELQVKAELGSSARADWIAATSVKASAESHASVEATAAIDIDFGAELAASLDAFAVVKVIDIGVKVGGDLEASAYVGGNRTVSTASGITTMNYTESMHIKSVLTVPIINLYIGSSDTLIAKANISKDWDVAGKYRKEHTLIDKEWVFWSETVQIGADGKPIEEEKSNTYQTRFAEANRTGGATFEFDYPDNWTITSEDVSSNGESVTLTSDSGARIVFYEIPESISIDGGGSGITMYRADISKVDDSALPGYMVAHIETTNYDRLAGDESTGPAKYAVLPSSRVGEQWDSRADMAAFSFDHTGYISFIAYPVANTQFSDKETEDVLAILSSFRISNSDENRANAVNFSSYAGTYKLIDASPFNNYYGIPTEITLNHDGAISGSTSFPNTAPISIEQNEAGAICCIVARGEKAGRGPDESPFSYNGNFYIICPEAVSSTYADVSGYDQITGTDTVRIRLVSVDGGIMDIMYSK